jgi:hypothetical protein
MVLTTADAIGPAEATILAAPYAPVVANVAV